jgi:hypothetical protein
MEKKLSKWFCKEKKIWISILPDFEIYKATLIKCVTGTGIDTSVWTEQRIRMFAYSSVLKQTHNGL